MKTACIADEDDLSSHNHDDYIGTYEIYWYSALSIIVIGTFITSMLLLYTLYEVNRRQQLAYQGDEVAARRLILPCYKPLVRMLAIVFFILAVSSCGAYRYYKFLFLLFLLFSLFFLLLLVLVLDIFTIHLNYYNCMDCVYQVYIQLVHQYYCKNLYQPIALKNVHM
jgi:hypothetical protein